MKKVLILIIMVAVISGFSLAQESKKKEVTLKDVIFKALKNNLDLQIQKTDTRISLESLKMTDSIFIPQLQVDSSYSKALEPSTDVDDGTDVVSFTTKSGSIGISQGVPYGGTLSMSLATDNTTTNSLRAPQDPGYKASVGFSLVQPLLKNFGKLASRYQIYIATNDYKVSKLQLQRQIVDLVYNVESAYWELVYAYQNLDAKKMALKRAKDLLKQNEIKVKVGTAAPIEILSSKAQVASTESQLILAERTIQSREVALKRILNISTSPDIIMPVDKPLVEDSKVDLNEFLLEALENRVEIKQAKLNLENNNIRVRYAKNQTLPGLQLRANFSSKAAGGTTWNYSVTPRVEANITTLGETWEDVLKLKNKNYSFFLTLQIPLNHKVEKAKLTQANIYLEKSLFQLKNLENTIHSEVKEVIKELESNRKLVDANKVAEDLESESLKAELKKLSVGISTNFEVLNVQRRYADAQTATLRSNIDYRLTLAKIKKILNRTFRDYDINFSDYYK